MKELSGKIKRPALLEMGMLLVVLVSICYVAMLAGGNPEVFLIDDNRTQWYPVMERAYEDFWTTGRIYCYDFYQMKGMSVAGQGYYGVMNPFILLSFAVVKILPGAIDAITCYIGIMVVLGNFLFYLVCRRLGCRQSIAFLMTLTYSTMGCFWAFFYWYYVFNNYFLVPLLVYLFLRCKQEGRLKYCACGIMLAMDLWMGNVQYTFYHYILFGILCLTMMILKDKRYFKVLCVNAALGIMLSLPAFLLLLQASGGFSKHEDFMKYPLFYFSLLIHSAIPQGILRQHGSGFSFLDSFVIGRNDNLVCYMGAVSLLLLAVLARAGVRLLKWIRKQESGAGKKAQTGTREQMRCLGEGLRAGYEKAAGWSHEKKTATGCAAALFFFLSLMSGGLAAYLLSVMPVVNNFRYLFKAIFLVAPLAVLVLAYLFAQSGSVGGADSCAGVAAEPGSSIGRRARFVTVFLAVYACVGVLNACNTVEQTRNMFDMRLDKTHAGEKAAALSMLEAADVDGKNYRTAAFLQFSGVNDEHFDLARNLTKNFATAVGIFSLAGYEIATPESRLEMFDAVYSDTDFYSRYANADTQDNLNQNLIHQPEKVQSQLVDNGVRYLLLDKTTIGDNMLARERGGFCYQADRRTEIIAALDALPNLSVAKAASFNDHYDLVELAGVNSLCMDEEGNIVPLTDENMQTLSFAAEEAGNYTLSFAWDSHLEACVTGMDGVVRPLTVEETENGNIRISTAGSAGRVTLTWHYPLCTAGFVWESVTTFAFFGLLVALAFLGRKCYSDM